MGSLSQRRWDDRELDHIRPYLENAEADVPCLPSYQRARVGLAKLNSAADRGRSEQRRQRLSRSPPWL